MLKRIPPILLCAYFLFFLIPLVVASLARPFGWWDWLTVPKGMLGNEPLNPAFALLKWCYHLNLVYHWFIVRPTSAMFYYASYLIFHGEFWAWYLVKWTGFFLAVFWTDRLIRRFGADLWTRLLIAAFLIAHPASFVLMLFSPDGWAALWIAGIALLMFRLAPADAHALDVQKYSRAGYALFLLTVWLAIGIKEVVVVHVLVLAAVMHWLGGWRATLRVAPLYLMTGFYFWRMWGIAQTRDRASASDLFANLLHHLDAIAPPAPYWLFALLIAAGLVYALRLMLSRNEPAELRVALFVSLASASGMLVFTSMVRPSAVRYVIPVVYMLAFPLAMAASRLPAAWDIPKIAVALLIPLFCAGDLFSQNLAYQQLFDEKASVLNLVERRAAEGYEIAVPSDASEFPREYQMTIRYFFTRYRSEFYGMAKFPRVYELGKESPKSNYLVVARYGISPDRWAKPGFHFDSADSIDRGRYGFLENMTRRLESFNRAIRNTHPPHYDTGSPGLSDQPAFQIAYFVADNPAVETEGETLEGEMTNYSTGARSAVDFSRPFRGAVPRGQHAVIALPLHVRPGQWRILTSGRVRVASGKVTMGIGNEKGQDLWNTQLKLSSEGVPLPQPPQLQFSQGQNYRLFFFVPDGAELELTDFAVRKEQLARMSLFRLRRYGAFGY